MNKLRLALLLIAPMTNAQVPPSIEASPAQIDGICGYHPDKVACVEYIISVAKASAAAGVVKGICAVTGDKSAKERENCRDAVDTVEFIEGH